MRKGRRGCAVTGVMGVGLALFVAACSREGADPASRPYPYHVAATVGMIADVARAVAGEHAEVVGIIGSGVDPHLYRPTRDDVAHLLRANVLFYNGLKLEGRMSDVLARVAASGKPVIAVAERVEEDYLLAQPESKGQADPHVWMDVRGWMRVVRVIAEALADFDPERAEDYRHRSAQYLAELEKLDAYVGQVIGSIPEDQRVLVTAHDAFGYFGRAYGLEVRGIQGISTESEAGLRQINELVDLIVARKVRAVFVETSVAEKSVRAIIEAARSRGQAVVVGGTLFSDAMGPPGTYEGTYIGMIDHNATVIARALGGRAPERGFQGQLRGQP